jgi:hypothetical protein
VGGGERRRAGGGDDAAHRPQGTDTPAQPPALFKMGGTASAVLLAGIAWYVLKAVRRIVRPARIH